MQMHARNGTRAERKSGGVRGGYDSLLERCPLVRAGSTRSSYLTKRSRVVARSAIGDTERTDLLKTSIQQIERKSKPPRGEGGFDKDRGG